MLATFNDRAVLAGDALFNASRQLWLASLGTAVVTRDWARKEAGGVFRTLVREGTAVESRAFRLVGDRLDKSFDRANALWKRTRHSVTATVRAYADTAATIVRDSLPALVAPEKPVAKKPAKHARKAPVRKSVKRTPRTKARSKRA